MFRSQRKDITMTTVRVFDPAMCCSTGVCGPSVDPQLARFAADLLFRPSTRMRLDRRSAGVTGSRRRPSSNCSSLHPGRHPDVSGTASPSGVPVARPLVVRAAGGAAGPRTWEAE